MEIPNRDVRHFAAVPSRALVAEERSPELGRGLT